MPNFWREVVIHSGFVLEFVQLSVRAFKCGDCGTEVIAGNGQDSPRLKLCFCFRFLRFPHSNPIFVDNLADSRSRK